MTVASYADRSTRIFWRTVGRRVALASAENWLAGPMSSDSGIGDRWLAVEASRLNGHTRWDSEGGLLASMTLLDGPQFRANHLHPTIRHFYEHTAQWSMQVRATWSPWFRPPGALVTWLFARRVEQLALPAHGRGQLQSIHSDVVTIIGRDGDQVAAGWVRTVPEDSLTVYSGCYDVRSLPNGDQPQVHVSFPLESGNVQVFLTPSVVLDGALQLTSPPGPFGDPGAYVVVRDEGTFAARVPLHERFLVFVDRTSRLRAIHDLRLGACSVVRLDYVMHRTASHN